MKNFNKRRGLGLAELLIAVSISAAVLTAVAVSADAGFASYQANAAAGDTSQRVRLTLDRGLALLRSTDDMDNGAGTAHDPGPLTPSVRADFARGETVEDVGFVVYEPYTLADGTVAFRTIAWEFDDDSGELRQTIDGGPAWVVLRNVVDFRCAFQPMRSSGNTRRGILDHDQLRRATMVLTVGVSAGPGVNPEAATAETFTLSGSASPRRNVGV